MPGGSLLDAADLAVGVALVAGGAVAWWRRRESRTGALVAAAGAAWLLAWLTGSALYLHRGPMVHALLAYPSGRVRTPAVGFVVAVAYVAGAVPLLARSEAVTLALAAAVEAVAVIRFARAGGRERRARAAALGASTVVCAALAAGAVDRMGDLGGASVTGWLYVVAFGVAGAWLVGDLLRAPWTRSAVAGLVVQLGAGGAARTLRDTLARALGDPSLVLAYRAPDGGYVDEAGRPLALPAASDPRAVTPIVGDGPEPIALLLHDPATLADDALRDSVVAAAGLALANARLEAEAQATMRAVDASRRRLVAVADDQRRQLERELRDGAARRLAHVESLIAGLGLEAADETVRAARVELGELARGLHPGALTEGGLPAALADVAARCTVPVSLDVPASRFPMPVEIAAYYVCAEALANAAKHAHATRATIAIRAVDGRVEVDISDDGVGGAALTGGSGLRGLADRVDALGGRLSVESPAGGGTRVLAELPTV